MKENILIVFDCFGVIFGRVSEDWLKIHLGNERGTWFQDVILKKGDEGIMTYDEIVEMLSKETKIDKNAIKEEWLKKAVPNLELIDFIKKNKDQYHIVMLSNATLEFINQIFDENYNVRPLFERIMISASEHMSKPDKRFFELIIKESGENFDKVFMIDDNIKNIKAAESVGMIGLVYKDYPSFIKEIQEYIKIRL